MASGRRAALPASVYRSPVGRDERGAAPGRVVVYPEHGRYVLEFDFTVLPVSEVMQRWFIDRFVAATRPGGPYRAEHSVRALMTAIRSFAAYLGSLEHPPASPAELSGAQWDGWILSMRVGARKTQMVTLRNFAKGCTEVPAEFLARTRRTQVHAEPVPLQAYSAEEFNKITAIAKADVRDAVRRIRDGRALLADWKAGRVDHERDPHRWEHGSLLDFLDCNDDVPKYPSGRTNRRILRHGGVYTLFAELYPTIWDMSAAAVLLICLTGHNLSPILELPAAAHRPAAQGDRRQSALVDITKPRRGRTRAHMNVALTDAGADRGAAVDVSSAFGVYEIVRELSEPVRARTGSDLAFGYFTAKSETSFRPRLTGGAVGRWARSKEFETPAAGAHGPAAAVSAIDTRRLRLTWLQIHQQPVAHTEQTLANDYLARDRGNLAQYQQVVAETLAERVEAARQQVRVQTVTVQQVQRARSAPEQVAAELNITPGRLDDLLAGRLDTALAGCTDFFAGPHTEAGQPCTASFLMCLSCPCARATPAHLPVIVAVHDRLQDKAREMTPLRWAQRFAGPVAQLADITGRYPPAMIADAREQLTDQQHELVDRFLAQALDVR